MPVQSVNKSSARTLDPRATAANSARRRRRASLASAIRATMERLEGRQLMAADPFANEADVAGLPFVLEFDGSSTVGLHDKDGEHVGFTRIQVNKNGRTASYVQANLDQAGGLLNITTTGNATSGSSFNGDNTLTNAVETTFDGNASGFSITARLVGPMSYINEPSEQAGISFGPGQDEYVKLIAVSTPQGQRLQFVDETLSNGTYVHGLDALRDVGGFASINTLDLRMVGDAATGKVTAFYSINGEAYQKFTQELTLTGTRKSAFFAANSRAGLVAAHKNNTGAITAVFDRFEIQPGTPVSGRPTIASVNPANAETNVLRDAFVRAQLNLTGGGIASETLDSTTVRLFRTSDRLQVPANVGTSGAGDVITLKPSVLLDKNTNYTFEVTDGLKDVAGNGFVPFSSNFTTGTAGGEIDASFSFEKVNLSTASGEKFTALKVGPDRKLYAGAIDGRIFRFPIRADGTLGAPQVLDALQQANGGNKRLLAGFTFDPASTASNPVLWVTHGQYRFGLDPNGADPVNQYADDWTGKISRITNLGGSNTGTVADVVKGLPRSVRDHLTNQPSFGPDGALYFAQGSNSAGGAPDAAWGNRPERLLTAAVLRLDPAKVPAGTVLDVKTGGGGTYNPAAVNAPLTIYATGVRNAYDLVWANDGRLFVPTNATAAGANTPGGGGVPGLTNIGNQRDFLFRVEPGGYYGHPNPLRQQYVFNAGYTPDNGVGPNELPEYGTTVQPDPDYKGFAYNFDYNVSPNGIIEYQNSSQFGGRLAGKLMVVRYSGPDDIMVLTRDAAGNIVQAQKGIVGLGSFVDPLDIVEDPQTGFLYVSEFSERDATKRRITLLRPIPPGAQATPSKDQLVFTDIQTPSTNGSTATASQSITITNTGTSTLTIPAGGASIVDDPAVSGDHAAQFEADGWPALPASVAVGESITFKVRFRAATTGLKAALLRVQSNDVNNATLNLALRGIGTTSDSSGVVSGSNEASLQRILDAFQIPVNVGDANGADTYDLPTPRPAGTAHDEVEAQRLRKAGAGPVRIEPLAGYGFNTKTGPVGHFGIYTPGSTADRTELFTVAASQNTSTNPTWGATFDPGADEFGLWGTFNGSLFESNGVPYGVYSEDTFNTFDSVNKRKVRFFPLENKDGTTEPNAFVFAFEEFNAGYDSNDIVGIIRNVQPVTGGPEIGVENRDGVPFHDRLVFNRIQDSTNTAPTPNNKVHDQATLRIHNSGSQAMTLSSLVLSSGSFQLVNPPAANTTIAAGSSRDVTVKFVATSGAVHTGTLTINSNDADEPATVVQLAGHWQLESENNKEPSLQQIVQVMGYGTAITHPGEELSPAGQEGRIQRVGDEVLSAYWKRADAARAVTVRQLAAYHTQGNVARVWWYPKGGATSTSTLVLTHDGEYGQSLLPTADGSDTAPAFGTFKTLTGSPATEKTFGFKIDSEWSDPAKNTTRPLPSDEGHHVRFWVAKDRDGKVIPDTYLMSMDYSGINYDYQDNVYVVSNIKPESGPSTPSGLTASASGSGVFLNWNDNTQANLAGYNVYRGTSSTFTPGSSNRLNSSLLTQSDFNDIFAPTGTTVYYKVSAVDTSGNQSGFASASATRSSDTTAPAAPAGLVVTGSTSGITLDWANNTEVDLAGYDVSRSTSANGTFTKLNTSLLTTSSYVDTTAVEGVESFYRVVAKDQSGNTSPAATGSAVRGEAVAPSAPTGLAATPASSSSVTVTWNAATAASTYRVERKGPGEIDFIEIAVGVTGTTYTNTSLTPETTYSYRVRAENTTGLSGYSNIADATTPAPSADPALTGTNIAAVPAGSHTVVTEGTAYDVSVGGNRISETSDAIYFLHKQVTGDFDVKVRVASIANGVADSRGGLMARASLDANSPMAFVGARASGSYRGTYRTSAGAVAATQFKAGVAAFPNAWVRLRRVGDTFTAFYGGNGTSWTQFYAATVNLPGTVFLGLAASAYNSTAANFAFRDYDGTAAEPAPAPGVPANLRADGVSSSQVDLAWDAAANAARYRVERKGPGEASFTEIADVTGTTYQDTGRAANTAYEYRVRAVNASGVFSAYSAVVTGTTQQASAPAALTGTNIAAVPAGSHSVVTEGAAYDVSVGGNRISETSDAIYFLHKQVTGDFDVKVRVASIANGVADSRGGLMARATLDANSPMAFVGARASGSYRGTYRTTAGATAATQFKAGVAAFPNAWVRLRRVGDTFTAFYGGDGTSWTQMYSQTVNLPDSVFLGLAASAYNSTAANFTFRDYQDTTAAPQPQPPGVPGTLSATAVSSSRIDLTWGAASGATSYRIERRPQGGSFAEIASNVTTTTYQDTTGLAAATTYEYQVRAVNAQGNGAFGNIASATTLAEQPVTGLTGTNIAAVPAGSHAVVTEGSAYDVSVGGNRISETSDAIYFLHKQVTGDFDVKVRVAAIANGVADSRGGLMARASLDANSAMAFVGARASGAYRGTYRTAAGAVAATQLKAGVAAFPNAWVRLRRVGDVFTAFYGSDGTGWTQLYSQSVDLPDTVFLGLAASAYNSAAADFQFRDYSDTQSV